MLFIDGAINRDMTVLALPLLDQSSVIALIGLVGGLSAATAMVVVASVALACSTPTNDAVSASESNIIGGVDARGRGMDAVGYLGFASWTSGDAAAGVRVREVSVHRLAPPITVFCGAPGTSG